MASVTAVVDAVSSSEAASLHGHKALTPMISGIISGSCVGIAWIIGFIIYFYKRHRREKRARALGFKNHREMLDPPKKPEAFIIPPDPAVVEGGRVPGERIYNDPGVPDSDLPKHAKTIPFAHLEKADEKTGSDESSLSPRGSGVPHAASAPSRVPQKTSNQTATASTAHERTLPSPASPRRISSEMMIPQHV